MLLDAVGVSLSGNILSSKGMIRAGDGVHRAGQDF